MQVEGVSDVKTYQTERYANKLAKEFVTKNLLAMIVVRHMETGRMEFLKKRLRKVNVF